MVVEEKQNPLGYEKISTLVRKMSIPDIFANVVRSRVFRECGYEYCLSNYDYLYGDWINGRNWCCLEL